MGQDEKAKVKTTEGAGTVIKPDQAALVAAEDTFELFMPHYEDKHAPLPREVLLLMAVAMRSTDEQWVDEMIEALEERSAELRQTH